MYIMHVTHGLLCGQKLAIASYTHLMGHIHSGQIEMLIQNLIVDIILSLQVDKLPFQDEFPLKLTH